MAQVGNAKVEQGVKSFAGHSVKCQSDDDDYGDCLMRYTLITGFVVLSLLAGCNTYNNTPANNEDLL